MKIFAEIYKFICIFQKKSLPLQPKVAKEPKLSIMDRPVFKKINTPEEAAAAFERWIHLREEWEEQIRIAKAARQIA